MEKERLSEPEKRFDESFDNITIFDYDKEYREGACIQADSLVYSDNRHKLSLNGQWHFCVDVFDSAIRCKFFNEVTTDRHGRAVPCDFSLDEWDTVAVPGDWNSIRPEYALYEGTGLYTRTFPRPDESPDNRVFLRIGAANYETRIWLNKTYLGKHIGGYTPFMAEITHLLQEENRLFIYVNSTRKAEAVPSLNYDWFNFGGIHRDIEMVVVPQAYIKRFRLNLLPNGLFDTLELNLETENAPPKCECRMDIPELGIENLAILVEDNRARVEIPAKPVLWSPENPRLYEVRVSFEGDTVTDWIGFREIRTDGSRILLNGQDCYLKGMCAHEENRSNGRSVDCGDIENMLVEAKSLGCNFMRLTHYPHNENTAKLADKLGIMLWEEIPVYWALEFRNPATFDNAKNQLEELIIRDFNRASVIIWSVGNENPDSDERFDFMSRLVDAAKAQDPSRLISASCLIDMASLRIRDRLTESVDVVGVNEYYGWYFRDFAVLDTILTNSYSEKPVIITETGAEAVSGRHGAIDELYTEECQAEIYKRQFSAIEKYPYIRGITPWIMYDYASMRRISKQQGGFNLKGLLSKDRRHKKLAYDVVKEFYSKK